jgi:hypothetical protein
MQASVFDVIIVGADPRMRRALGQEGWCVCVLERADTLGGCIRTEELTAPGFRHDTLSPVSPVRLRAALCDVKEERRSSVLPREYL